ncbi:MAG TPA: hypothetical protein PKV85_02885 [Spirochaetota bacterium]|nr:hypothetical protein [Spirochaetota bacterium]
MDIKKITYLSAPNCYELTIGKQKMIVATDFGPRIMHLSIDGGENMLFNDEAEKFKSGYWKIYGGHRLWVSPENRWDLDPNNEKCDVILGENSITVKKLNKNTDLEKTITVTEKNQRFNVTHTITNKGQFLFAGAIWALTCFKPKGTIFVPWASHGSFKMSKIIYWNQWTDKKTNVNSSQFSQNDDYFMININGETSKIGSAAYDGYVGITTDNYTFIKKFDRVNTNDYPDDNCAVECFTCADFVELETLSPNVVFAPEVTYSHTEEWFLFGSKVNVSDKKAIDQMIR